ncbi:uncharacterized protein B0I36DRAFT_48673 [Microdochium trichocladiopsis]|uniref:TRP C-terminal domain-containing protein n=1 Tax=Microdochium trichocladiopsis TaxID=1682393 RepID=A0A9P8XRL7_9PEZI|nr:uncharacterized protein B0I36DRAFT_48673 [Microdochium trichocladiopsis]KAH7014210.1 hypothetical protein B0I36DRAFT_48673 [Microdochium trichocladiopsis]
MTAARNWLSKATTSTTTTALAVALLATTIPTPAQGAYIQTVPCLGLASTTSSTSQQQQQQIQQQLADPVGLRIRLEHLNATHDRLLLSDSTRYTRDGCDHWAANYGVGSVALELSTLGRDDSVAYFALAESCSSAPKQTTPAFPGDEPVAKLSLQADYPRFGELSTFQLALYFLLGNESAGDDGAGGGGGGDGLVDDLHGPDDARIVACLRSAATPQPSTWLLAVLRYVPMSILALVLVAAVIRSLPSTAATTAAAAASTAAANDTNNSINMADQGAPGTRRRGPILPGVGDCLQYLQFVFLTACLSLRYPGFYQPAVSELRWYSLFGTTLWVDRFAYDGYVDGVYELNGTFGGTYGAELMTQVVGAPLTTGTWVNMVICVGIAAGVVGVLLWALWVLEARKAVRLGLPPALGHRGGSGGGAGGGSLLVPRLVPLASNVAKVILSYFMLPVVALTVYQLDYANSLPVTHSTFAVVLLVGLVGVFGWLVWRIPTRSLGVLLFDSSNRYRRLDGNHNNSDYDDYDDDDDNDNDANNGGDVTTSAAARTAAAGRTRADQIFVYALFLTTFIRAALIGGVQISGLTQVVALFCTEFLFAAYIVAMQAYPLLSIGSFSAGVRVLSIAAMIAFVPDMVSESPREVIGYAVLGMHAVFLVCGFGGMGVWHLGSAVVGKAKRGKEGEIYGLRDLQRRPNARNALALRSDLSLSPAPPPPPHDQRQRRALGGANLGGGRYSPPHPGTRLNLPSLYGDSTASLSSFSSLPYYSPVSPIRVKGGASHIPSLTTAARSDSPSDSRRLDSMSRSSEPRSSSSGSVTGTGTGTGSRSGNRLSGVISSGSSSGGTDSHYFRPPRASTYATSLAGSADGRGSRNSLVVARNSGLIPASPLSPGGGGGGGRVRLSIRVVSPTHDDDNDNFQGQNRHRHRQSGGAHTPTNRRSFTKSPISAADDVDTGEPDGHSKHDDKELITPSSPSASATTTATSPLGPRWNDYSFREADLIYGGPEEGEFEAARAHYGLPRAAEDEVAGRSSTTTMGTTSTSSSSGGSKPSSRTAAAAGGSKHDDADDDDRDEAGRGSGRVSRSSLGVTSEMFGAEEEEEGGDSPPRPPAGRSKKNKKAAAAKEAAKNMARARISQLRQFSSSSKLSVTGKDSATAGASSAGDPTAAAASAAPEQGFSVRRPPRPPEHVLRQMAAAARAQQHAQMQQGDQEAVGQQSPGGQRAAGEKDVDGDNGGGATAAASGSGQDWNDPQR